LPLVALQAVISIDTIHHLHVVHDCLYHYYYANFAHFLPTLMLPCCRVRIMGFPESFRMPTHFSSSGKHTSRKQYIQHDNSQNSADYKKGGCGDSRANLFYRQIGNAVCPPVIRAIGELMCQQLQKAETKALGMEKTDSSY
jgi:site-specific DNA-cytosine methylase